MADEKNETVSPAATEAPAADTKAPEAEVADKAAPPDGEKNKDEAPSAEPEKPTETPAEGAPAKSEEPKAEDTEMKDAAEEAKPAVVETPASKNANRRKSGAGESKTKALNKKGSKARLTNIDAKPGDHFLVKLKGFPAWPAIICDEDMLPEALLSTRPVTAARADGTYSENYADGGKRVNDRTFPVMYLYTNEFGWVANGSLTELSAEKARDSIKEKMRADLKAAFELAAEDNALEFYKKMLTQIMNEMEEKKQRALEAAATPKKSKKGKSKDDEDEEMADAEEGTKSAKSKKRKAEDDASTPARSDSVKKPKIKLTTTPKTANGTPKTKDESAAKSKAKPKKAKEDKKSDAKEVKQTPAERLARKEKEVLYLRHKLQRGLLTRDQQPQESEMPQMAEFITMLENFKELEVSIIRATKINKVLKAILKLDSIPREEEFSLKKRSQTLLDQWNKLMAADGGSSTANGINGTEAHKDENKPEANGVKQDDSKKDSPEKEAAEEKEEPKPAETAVEA